MELHHLINATTAEIQYLYLRDNIPWIVGCSWGKDSSCTLQLIWKALAKLSPEQRHKNINVITTDTGVENPIIANFCRQSIEKLNAGAEKYQMPFKAHLLKPTIDNSFWVLSIGKGYARPTHQHRWCTPRLKIAPSDRFIKQYVSQHGESILALGVRKDESIKRKTSIEKHQGFALEQNLSSSSSLLNCTIYTPIADWTTSQVWQYLLQIENPWGGSNQQLFQIYRGATNSAECPLVVEENTTSCGKSRFGCYVCTVASSEHSLTSMIENSAETVGFSVGSFPQKTRRNEWLEPLLELREILANSSNSDRNLRLTTKGVQFHFNKVNSQINLEPTPGKYHQNFRTALLTKLLEAQKQIKINAPKQYRDFEFITLEELSQIRYLWLTYHHEIEDLLPKIYQSVMEKKYCELAPERLVNKLDDDFWQTAKEIADEPEARLIASLLNVEAKHQAINQRQGIYQALNQQIKQQKMSQESEIYLGYKSKQAKNIDKAASTIAFLKLTNRPIPKNKILRFQ